MLAFSGQEPALEKGGHMVVVNTLNTHPELGSLGLLNCHRLVFPMTFGDPKGWDNWSLAAWCDQCHRKDGLVIWSETGRKSDHFDYGESLADLILGKVDAFEVVSFHDSPVDPLATWYDLLNAGLRVPLVAGSAKQNNGNVLGRVRTYAHLLAGESFCYKTWIEAVRAGRTFVSNSPLLYVQVEGRDPGATIQLPSAGQVHVHAEARSFVPFDSIEILRNGDVVATAQASGSPTLARLDVHVPVAESAWLAVRCRGQYPVTLAPYHENGFAHSSPVYLCVASQPPRPDPRIVAKLDGQLVRMLEWVHGKARCENPPQRDHLAGLFQQARETLRRRSSGQN
jgi:hypothetical protein